MGEKISFKEYLKLGLKRGAFKDSPESDFAGDALADKKFRDFENWEQLETFLAFHSACPEAITAAKRLFRKWKAGS